MQKLRMIKDPQQKVGAPLIGLDPNHPRADKANLAVYQVVAQLPFQLDVSFTLSDSGSWWFLFKNKLEKQAHSIKSVET